MILKYCIYLLFNIFELIIKTIVFFNTLFIFKYVNTRKQQVLFFFYTCIQLYFDKIYTINFSFSTDIMFLTILLSPILFLFLLHCFIRYGRKGRILSRIPEPKAYPIIGNIHRFRVDNGKLNRM